MRTSPLVSLEGLLRLSPYQFEDRIAELYRALGYHVDQTPYSNDRGRDAIMSKDGRTYLLECKQYDPARVIGRRDLQVFYAAIIEANAECGFFVTTGRTAKTALEFVEGKPIELVDRLKLTELLNRAYPQGEDDRYKVMCSNCGTVVLHSLLNPQKELRCHCGNSVFPSLSLNDVSGTGLPVGSRSRKSRRGFKRRRR
jgi:hypothetical protein